MNTKKKEFILCMIIIVLILIIIASLVFYCIKKNTTYGIVRIDKIPYWGALFLELDKPAYTDSRGLQPLTWEDLGPGKYENGESWLYLNPYTQRILQKHLKENNLAIAPGYYPDHHLSANFEEVLETFEFIELK